jgi:hypothetical protein
MVTGNMSCPAQPLSNLITALAPNGTVILAGRCCSG